MLGGGWAGNQLELARRLSFNVQNWFICSSIRNWIAYANEANDVNKDSPIDPQMLIKYSVQLN